MKACGGDESWIVSSQLLKRRQNKGWCTGACAHESGILSLEIQPEKIFEKWKTGWKIHKNCVILVLLGEKKDFNIAFKTNV